MKPTIQPVIDTGEGNCGYVVNKCLFKGRAYLKLIARVVDENTVHWELELERITGHGHERTPLGSGGFLVECERADVWRTP